MNKKRIKWTIELCQVEALKYETRTEFYRGNRSGYDYAYKNKILDVVCSHTPNPKKNRWTFILCQEEALKYNTLSDFIFGSSPAYQFALRNKHLDKICDHMIKVGNLYSRCIYACEFPDNHVYIGLTYNIDKRMKLRECNDTDTVTEYKNITGLDYNVIQLTDYIDKDEASILEGDHLEIYKSNNWIILNKMKTGGLGSGYSKWNIDNLTLEASKFNSRVDFSNQSKGAYQSAHRQGVLDDICGHMIPLIKKNGYWNWETCSEEALKYETRYAFAKGARGAYGVCLKNDWVDELFPKNS
jgi:hypothetical protein